MPRILVVDDDRETCRFMDELLRGADRHIELAHTPDEALALAQRGGFDLVVSDINLNAELSGLDLLRAFKRADPRLEILLISGFGTLETAIEAVRAGAFDYVSKPFDIVEVKETVDRALKRRAQPASLPAASEAVEAVSADGLIGRSRGMLGVYKQIAHAAGSDAPVLVTGETGTGKELIARALHHHSRRAARPFVPVNCGALAESLLESELFGHVRGSFTGALGDKKGVFEQAHGGSIFLDEIGETTAAVQVRLLRVLEQGEVRPLGASRVTTVNVRVVAATNRDLERAVREGSFRQDLYYRLNVIRIAVPPLRDRREDIPLLAAHVLRDVATRGGPLRRLSPEALAALMSYAWPGNVRELENVLERLALAATGDSLEREDLPAVFRERPPATLEEPLFDGLPSLEQMEKRYLAHVLETLKGNRTRAAEVLGIDRRTLYRMMERFGMDGEQEK
ncbi:MAG TPA: sigma-54 dependent transcriptional regulator [Vicinamibacteria bacterium]